MPRKRKKTPAYRRPRFWVVSLLLVAVFLSGCWVWFGLYAPSPRFDFIVVSVNQELQKILSGKTLSLHPNDTVRILKVSTSVPLNLNVRLAAKDFDADAFCYDELKLSTQLPEGSMLGHYVFRIWVKYRNQILGYVDWQVRPYAEDWLEKASRTINSSKRLAILEQARQLMPEDRGIQQRLLSEYKSQKKWNEAANLLERMAGKKPSRELLNELLDVYRAAKKKEAVISVLKRLVDLAPHKPGARRQLAQAFEIAGEYKAAIKEYEYIVGQLDKRSRLDLHKHLGYLYTKTGKVKKAISHYLKAAVLDKGDANLYYNLSYLYEKVAQNQKSDLFLGKALRLKPKDVEGRLKLASRLIKRKEMKGAEVYLEEALKIKPRSIKALLLLSQVAEKLGEKEKLRKIYKRILSLDPSNQTVIYNLGTLEYGAGNVETSLSYFNKYLKLQPKDPGVHAILFDIYRGRKNSEKAFKEALILVELEPKVTDPYYFIFEYLKTRDNYDKMIPIIERGLKAGLTDTLLREYLVVAYLRTGKEKSAIGQIQEILKVRPKDIDLLLHLAKLKEKSGDLTGALKTYEHIMDISPSHEEAGEAYLRLRLKGINKGEGAR